MPGAAEHAPPVAQHHVDALLLERGDAVDLRRPRHRKRAHAATLDVLGELAQAGDAAGHVAADDVGDLVAAALRGDVVHLRRIDARRARDQACEDVVRAAGRAAVPGYLARIGLVGGDQVRHRLVRRSRRNDHDEVLAGEPRDRRDHREVDRALLQHDAAYHDHAAHHQRVRVALGAVDELGEAEGARRTALVLELDGAHHLGRLHRGGERPPRLVPAAARVGRDHHLQRADRLCLRRADQRQGRGDGGGQRSERECTAIHRFLLS